MKLKFKFGKIVFIEILLNFFLRNLEKDGRGFIGLIPEEPEDMWHTYHLITVGDHVKSTTVRRVTKDISTGTIRFQKIGNLSFILSFFFKLVKKFELHWKLKWKQLILILNLDYYV